MTKEYVNEATTATVIRRFRERGARFVTFAFLALALSISPLDDLLAEDSTSAEPESFTHSISVHPIPLLPSLVTVVPREVGAFRTVRLLLVKDGELLTIPLSFDESAQAFRGNFPTPLGLGSYRFQITQRSGRVDLSSEYVLPPVCQQQLNTEGPSEQIGEALRIQDKLEQLQFISSVLRRLQSENL